MGLKNLAKKVKEKNAKDSVGIEEKFLKEIDSFLVSPPSNPTVDRLAFRPSSYYKCTRQLYYFLSAFPKKEKVYPRSQRILQVGTALHEWIQEEILMKMDGIKLLPKEELPNFGRRGLEIVKQSNAPDMEIKFIDSSYTEKFPVSGMVDGFIEYEDISFLFEFKTINPTDFAKLIEAQKDHVKQGAIYALSLGVKRVMFVYLCKGTQNMKAFMVEYNQDQLDWVENRLVKVEEMVINSKLPAKEVGMDCRFCSYKQFCDKDISKQVD